MKALFFLTPGSYTRSTHHLGEDSLKTITEQRHRPNVLAFCILKATM